jgi:hypothetical protein
LHYYLNFSGEERRFQYAYGNGSDLLTNTFVEKGRAAALDLRSRHFWASAERSSTIRSAINTTN